MPNWYNGPLLTSWPVDVPAVLVVDECDPLTGNGGWRRWFAEPASLDEGDRMPMSPSDSISDAQAQASIHHWTMPIHHLLVGLHPGRGEHWEVSASLEWVTFEGRTLRVVHEYLTPVSQAAKSGQVERPPQVIKAGDRAHYVTASDLLPSDCLIITLNNIHPVALVEALGRVHHASLTYWANRLETVKAAVAGAVAYTPQEWSY